MPLFILHEIPESFRPVGLDVLIRVHAAGQLYHESIQPVFQQGFTYFHRRPLAGAIAVCALVLPGLSGSFMLVLLSKYDVALAAVTARDFGVIVPLLLGGVIGILSFARVMSYLLKRYHDPMLALLTGFVIGSLRKVWPFVESDGVTATWPWTAVGPAPWGLALLIVAGVLAVLTLDRAGKRLAA